MAKTEPLPSPLVLPYAFAPLPALNTPALGFQPTGLIIGGHNFGGQVYNWKDHGLETKIGDGARKRKPKQAIDLFVWHWTGGEGDYRQLFRVLDNRELGVEFYIDQYGRIFQFADPMLVDTFDAGAYNPRSVGCEIACYGFVGKDREPPGVWGKQRLRYSTTMNGKRRVFARFFFDQLASAIWLGWKVGRAIPTLPSVVPTKNGVLYPDAIPYKTMESGVVKGHVGHYHLTDPEHPAIKRGKRQMKSDPGHDLLQAFLDSRMFQPQEV